MYLYTRPKSLFLIISTDQPFLKVCDEVNLFLFLPTFWSKVQQEACWPAPSFKISFLATEN